MLTSWTRAGCGDPRQTFFNMAFMTHASWDFMADARPTYRAAVGGTGTTGRWFAHFAPGANQLRWTSASGSSGDQLEIEHATPCSGSRRRAAARLRNRVTADPSMTRSRPSGRPDEERGRGKWFQLQLAERRSARPVLARKDSVKVGIGLTSSSSWRRTSASPGDGQGGQTEVMAFHTTDRSLSFGAVARGLLNRHATSPASEWAWAGSPRSRPVPRAQASTGSSATARSGRPPGASSSLQA